MCLTTKLTRLQIFRDHRTHLLAVTPTAAEPVEMPGLDLEGASERLQDRMVDLVTLVPGLVVGLVILLLAILLARWVRGWRRPYRRIDNTFLRDFARQAVALVVLLVGALIALDVMQATAIVAALLGTAGVAGLALGFAFKDLIENYIAGILLSLRQPFAPDDLVVIDGEQGRVVRLTMRATILMTLDGNHLRLPNAQVFKATILNYTRNPRRRFDIGVGVGVDTDLLRAQRLGIDTLASIEGVMQEPPPRAVVEELGDSNVLVQFYGWVDQREYDFSQVKSEAIRLVKTTLEDAEVDMPEPIYQVKMMGQGPTAKSPQSEPSEEHDPSAQHPPSVDHEPVQSLAVQDDLRSALDEEQQSGQDNLLNTNAEHE